MALLIRQQAAQSWVEADPMVQFGELLHALEHYKDVSTEYGLNLSVQHGWRFGDPHKKTAAPDRHDYDIKHSDGIELSPGPRWHNLYRRIVSQASEFLSFETVYLITDNRDLLANTVTTNPGPEPLAGGCCLVEREDQVCWPLRGAHDSGLCTDFVGYRTGKSASNMGWHLYLRCLCVPLLWHQLCAN